MSSSQGSVLANSAEVSVSAEAESTTGERHVTGSDPIDLGAGEAGAGEGLVSEDLRVSVTSELGPESDAPAPKARAADEPTTESATPPEEETMSSGTIDLDD